MAGTAQPRSLPPRRRRRAVAALAAVAGAAALLVAPAASTGAPASAATCSVTWGSLAKSAGTTLPGRITAVRAGRHTCYDRLVIDMTGRAAGFDVRYVTTVRTEGGGVPVPVAGGARLAVVAKRGATSVPSMPSVAGFSTFRQVRWAGSFEGYTTVALGVRARLPFRVGTLYDATTHSSRLVVDVAHHW